MPFKGHSQLFHWLYPVESMILVNWKHKREFLELWHVKWKPLHKACSVSPVTSCRHKYSPAKVDLRRRATQAM